MKKFVITLIAILLIQIPSFAFEDCIISSRAKMSNIKIEYNDIIDVYPIVTLMNEKNILIVHPLKEGKTRFIVTKGKKDTAFFNVTVKANETVIEHAEGFEVYKIDAPPTGEEPEFNLDEPPILNERI